MKRGSRVHNVLFLATGIVLLAVALFAGNDLTPNLSGLCIGLGSGIAGMSVARLIMIRYYAKHPALRRRGEIEAGDERSISINNLSKAKAFDITIRAMILIPFVLIFVNSPLWMTLAVVAFYLFAYVIRYYYLIKYSRVM